MIMMEINWEDFTDSLNTKTTLNLVELRCAAPVAAAEMERSGRATLERIGEAWGFKERWPNIENETRDYGFNLDASGRYVMFHDMKSANWIMFYDGRQWVGADETNDENGDPRNISFY